MDRFVTVKELSSALESHPNTLREHLTGLVEVGLVSEEASVPVGRGRPALRYRARRVTGSPEREYAHLTSVLAEIIAEDDDPHATALRAGERWGQRVVASLDDEARRTWSVTNELAGMGFDPRPERGHVVLRSCPILVAARTNPGVVCTAHAGLIRGLVEALGGNPDDAWLEPWGHPNGCIARYPMPIDAGAL